MYVVKVMQDRKGKKIIFRRSKHKVYTVYTSYFEHFETLIVLLEAINVDFRYSFADRYA